MVSRSFAVSLMLAATALQVQCISLKAEADNSPTTPPNMPPLTTGPERDLGMIELHSSSEAEADSSPTQEPRVPMTTVPARLDNSPTTPPNMPPLTTGPESRLGMIELHSSSEQYFDMIAVSEDSHVCLYGKKPAFQAVMKKDNRDALDRMKDTFAADDMKFQIEKTCHEYYGLQEEIPFKEWKGEASETPMCVDLKPKGYLGLSMCFNNQASLKGYLSKNHGRFKGTKMPPIPRNPVGI